MSRLRRVQTMPSSERSKTARAARRKGTGRSTFRAAAAGGVAAAGIGAAGVALTAPPGT